MDFQTTFTLTDSNGAEHTYETMLHPANEGDAFAWKFTARGVGPLLEALRAIVSVPAVQTVIKAMQGVDEGDETPAALEADAWASLFDAIPDIDTSAFAPALERVLESFADDRKLVADLLKYTKRDGEKLTPAVYGNAYRGNYLELMQAVGQVILVNDFFPVARLFDGLSSDESKQSAA